MKVRKGKGREKIKSRVYEATTCLSLPLRGRNPIFWGGERVATSQAAAWNLGLVLSACSEMEPMKSQEMHDLDDLSNILHFCMIAEDDLITLFF